jgi:hypothetical protein
VTRVAALLALAALCAACGSTGPPPIPTPIGVGPLFRPGAANPRVLAGLPVDGLRCGHAAQRFGVHLELFARGRVVIVPPGIGVARPFVRQGAYVRPRGCTYPVRTLDPTGVVQLDASRKLVLGDVFDVWGRPLSPTRLAGFRTSPARPVRAYVGGKPWRGPLRAIPLERHAEIVLELGPYIRPHRTFLFPPGL